MAWAKTLKTASYKGVEADIQSVNDKGGRAVASHEYPYRNGTDAEDLGLHGDHISAKFVFWGDDYEDRLKGFMDALRSPGAGVLVHPVFGTIAKALPVTWTVDHQSDDVDLANVEVEFIDSHASDAVFTAPSPLASVDQVVTSAEKARTAADSGLTSFINGVRNGPLGQVLAFKDKLQQSLNNMRRLLDITPLKVLLSDVDFLIYPGAFMANIRSLVDVALQGLPFGGNNNSYAVAGAAAINLVAANGSNGLDDFGRVLTQIGPQTMTINVANDTIDPAQSLVDAAAINAHAQVHAAAAVAEAAMIVLAAEISTPTLTRDALELLCNQTRAAAQAAITAAHAAYPVEQSAAMVACLREMAFHTQQAASSALQQRPALGQRAAPVAGPLRLVAQAIYADPTRTPELAKLNRLGRQPFIDRGQELTCYAN